MTFTLTLTQEIIDQVAPFWETDRRPSLSAFARMIEVSPRTCRRWQTKGQWHTARFEHSLYRDFNQAVYDAREARKEADYQKRMERQHRTGVLGSPDAQDSTGEGGVVSEHGKTPPKPVERLWGVKRLSELTKEDFKNAFWKHPRKPITEDTEFDEREFPWPDPNKPRQVEGRFLYPELDDD